ncbi:uncharacterized protein si:ch211-130h14.4 isoform X2 [Scophthalmus maximus]|uniref:uncharacterized protein si:ch211-130h14.4 isoform X2 n=1 Tax=Scophthalmus maximus TaxID=52904 RepID=UPI001FA8FD7D|nr:uncharacterized protein si:ch211-130h14.4 isoform X2 [Scophthalmus maximus]
MQGSSPDPDHEATARRQAQLEQRHLETYRNMHRLRDALRDRYAALLKDKVHSQRELLQQRDETTRRGKSQDETKKKQKKLAFSKLQHNDSYLRSLPKTGYYQVFDLQKQLVERGRLKSHHDLEDFYRSIEFNSRPSELQRSLQDVRKTMLESRSAADLTSEQHKTSEEHPCAAEDRGDEDDVSHSRLLEQGSGPGERSADLISGGSQEKDAIEQMFPKMKVPTFATLQPNIMRRFQSRMPDSTTPEIPEKSRKAEIYLRRLRQMHRLCLTNMAFSQRLLDRETDSPCWREEEGVQDLMFPGENSEQGKTNQTNLPPLIALKQPTSVQKHSRPRKTSARCMKIKTTHVLRLWFGTQQSCRRETPDPLSIEDVCRQKHIQIIDCDH